MAQRIGPEGHLILVDLDPENLQFATERSRGNWAERGRLAALLFGGAKGLEALTPNPMLCWPTLGVASTHLDRPEGAFPSAKKALGHAAGRGRKPDANHTGGPG